LSQRDAEIEKLLTFKGYGNPDGQFWFIGMEEQGNGSELELRWRQTFEPIEDLMRVHQRWVEDFEPSERFDPEKLIPTWATMSRIALRLTGSRDWSDVEQVRRYQSQRLGRRDGETFLSEILPLPAPSSSDWPYPGLFPTRAAYEGSVRHPRLTMLHELFERHEPTYVFCYGKANWEHHKEIFPAARFEPVVDDEVMLARYGSGVLVLTPFFVPYRMTNDLIERTARAIEERLR